MFYQNYIHNLKRHFKIEQKEIMDWIISSFITGLVIFFFVWRVTDYNINSGIIAFISIILSAFFMIGMFFIFAKAIAIKNRYTAHYKSYKIGLLVGFVISFISYGFLPIIFPGNIEVKIIERLRHGRVFPGENKREINYILKSTLIWMLILTALIKIIYSSTNLILFKYGYLIGAVIMMFAILPLPDNLGIILFYTNRFSYYLIAPFYFLIGLFIIIGIKNYFLIGLLVASIASYVITSPKINIIEK